MEIIFATKNQGKIKEIQSLLGNIFTIKSLSEIGLNIDIEEDAETFEGNSLKKATEIMKITNQIVMADDSGLEIDFLDKAPGVHSARYMGEDTPYDIKNKKILELLENVPKDKRTARFISVLTTVFPNGDVLTTKGVVEGFIHNEIIGSSGFGYDPIFYLQEKNKTMAQLTLDEKNEISHRGKAFNEMKIKLYNKLNLNN